MIALGLLLLSLPAHAGGEARREADELANRGAYAEALVAYRVCAAGTDASSRYCGTQAERLAPQAADDFAGWSVLMAVQRDYRQLPAAEATARVEAELAERPSGPAAAALRAWLAHERLRAGEPASAEGLSPRDGAWVEEGAAQVRQARRHAGVAALGGALAAVYVGVAARGLWSGGGLRGALPVAVGGFLLLGVLPVLAALPLEPGVAGALLVNAGWAAGALLLARSAPPALGAAGTFGGFLALAWSHGWLDRMGLP